MRVVAFALALLLGCGDPPAAPHARPDPQPQAPLGPSASAATPVLVGTGDIAGCNTNADEQTAALLDTIPGTVFTAGDNAYPDGTELEFRSCYDPSWGRHKARTRPAPGNHDYYTPDATAYFAYFGANAGPAGRGYYSYDLGSWHLISLNSNVAADAGSAQMQWLLADLAANSASCSLAYWHHPVFSSGKHGNDSKMAAIWAVLDRAEVDVVLAGHDHTYERFTPQDSAGIAEPRGIRQFVIGTGGRSLYGFTTVHPNSVVRHNQSYGVLKLTLDAGSYTWKFIPVAGSTFTDAGSADCQVAQPPGPAARITVSGGDNQSAPAGSAVPVPPSVSVTDANNNPVAGVAVTFAVTQGGGSVAGAAQATDANGIARVGGWTLGPTAGTNKLSAQVAGLSGVTLTATGTAPTTQAARIARKGGNNQSAAAGTPVATPPSVRVTDASGNWVPGVAVTFAVAAGGGSVTGAAQTTDANGIATVGSWTLGTTVGSNTLSATSDGLSGSPLTFSATATPGPASAAPTIALNAGNIQSATAGTAVAIRPSVKVTDVAGGPVAGVPVTFAIAAGGGTITGASQTTDAGGIATVAGWTLGTKAGTNRLTATSNGLTGSPVTFTATATAGAPAKIALRAGNNQTAPAGTAVSTRPSVTVTDAYGNAVPNVTVTWAVASGGGSITKASIKTGSGGIATVGSWILGPVPGPNTLSATASGPGIGDNPITFTATGS